MSLVDYSSFSAGKYMVKRKRLANANEIFRIQRQNGQPIGLTLFMRKIVRFQQRFSTTEIFQDGRSSFFPSSLEPSSPVVNVVHLLLLDDVLWELHCKFPGVLEFLIAWTAALTARLLFSAHLNTNSYFKDTWLDGADQNFAEDTSQHFSDSNWSVSLGFCLEV